MNIGTSINASIVASYTNPAARNPLPAPGNGNTKPHNLSPDARLDEKDKSQRANNKEKRESQQDKQQLNEDEKRDLQQLQKRDREVRAHEAAHMAAGGAHVRGGMSFDYERGPDGRMYAVGGEVSIDSSPVPNDPEATLRKANQVRAAALAPVDPSPTDRAVAADASMMASEARSEMLQESREKTQEQISSATEGRKEHSEASAQQQTQAASQAAIQVPPQLPSNSQIAAYQQAGQPSPAPRLDLSA